jgi:hypothetical protein
MTLDLNALTVESFSTLDGDPTQWMMVPPPRTDEYDCPDALIAPAETHERICTTV